MSRSRKKTPSIHYVAKCGWMKKVFNRRLRRNFVVDEEQGVPAVPDGNAYRRMNDSYDINDWHVVGTTYDVFRARQINHGTFENEKTCRSDYEKWYLRK